MIDAITQLDPQGQPIDDLAEAKIDQHIDDCGLLMLAAYSRGNRQEAEQWLQAQTKAIASRTPAHKARLEAEILARIEDPANCYFFETGALARFQRTGVFA
jgi:hypothetical protein